MGEKDSGWEEGKGRRGTKETRGEGEGEGEGDRVEGGGVGGE